MKLENKVAIITGSSRGIGNSIARRFVLEGAKVVICGSKLENANKACLDIEEDLKVDGSRLLACGVDMKDTESIKKIVSMVI